MKISEVLKKEVNYQNLVKKICFADIKYIYVFIFVIGLVLRMLFLFRINVQIIGQNSDFDSGFFIKGAELFVTSPIDYFKKFITMPFYIGYTLYLGVIYKITNYSNFAVALTQVIISSFTPIIVYMTAQKATNNRYISMFSGILMAIVPTAFRWDRYITSDSLGMFGMVICMYTYVLYINEADCNGKNKERYFIYLIVSMGGFLLMRTNASIMIALLVICLINRLEKKKKVITYTVIVILGAVIVAFLYILGGEYVHSMFGNLNYFKELYDDGYIVRTDYTYLYSDNVNLDTDEYFHNMTIIWFYRLIYFWTSIDIGTYQRYTFIYIVSSFFPMFFILPFAFSGSLVGVFDDNKHIKTFIKIPVIYCIVQVFTEVNIDWRYRDPILPALFILSAYGIVKIYTAFSKCCK